MQLDFFIDQEDETTILRKEMQALREQCDKVRKGQYAKIGELKKMYMETQHEVETLKAALCKCKVEPSLSQGMAFFTI